ncbi:uncharacterized protein LOC6601758 [Drosophila persimilis]|uniref:uncharacterized protein LOC6601758 n=1 Tax=Drosophila persimilis TaxID=7234 RepID=UPI000F07B8A3|nr:uncharacterized protein LOC6601758 [Drosophila persimilis]
MSRSSYSPSYSPSNSPSASESQVEDRLLSQDREPQQSSNKPLHNAGSSSVRFGRVSLVKCWLLGVLLLLTVAASWPTGTSAAPRRLSGRHLILPHRHHVHQRSADRQSLEHRKNITIVTPEPTSTLLCQYHKSAMSTMISLDNAKKVAERTMDAIICLVGQWLDYYWNEDGVTLNGAIDRYSLHSLNLTHPLHEETKKVKFDNDTKRFIYENQAEVGEASEELPKIADALMIVRHLMLNVTKGHSSYNCTFVHIIEKLSHNLYMAETAMNNQLCSMSSYTYTGSYPDHKFGVTLEAIKLLTVIQQKYKVLLEKQRDEEDLH